MQAEETRSSMATSWYGWDRFKTAIYENKKLACAKKWEYLHQALMGDPARDSLSGFSRSEGQYDDAVKWLMKRYHQPRKVIKQHTHAIIYGVPGNEGRKPQGIATPIHCVVPTHVSSGREDGSRNTHLPSRVETFCM